MAFSARETQGASGQRVNESFAQSQAAGDTQWMSNTAGVYAEVAPNETIAVEEAEASVSPRVGGVVRVPLRACCRRHRLGRVAALRRCLGVVGVAVAAAESP